MTKDTLTLGSTDLSEHVQSITVDMAAIGTVSQGFIQTVGLYPAPKWASTMVERLSPITDDQVDEQFVYQSVPDLTVRPEHRDLTSWQFGLTMIPPIVSVGRRCVMTPYFDYDLIKRAIRTYPKRMSRAKRKEARACERRRVERHNQWWSKR